MKPPLDLASVRPDTPLRLEVPRMLSRAGAASYCNVAPRTFSDWVARRILPGPVPGTRRWDRKALDLALDANSGITHDEQSDADAALSQWEKSGDQDRPERHQRG